MNRAGNWSIRCGMDVVELMGRLVRGERLSEAEAELLFGHLLEGRMEAAQIGAVLGILQVRGVTVDELVGAARVMRSSVVRVGVPSGVTVIDTCGTGGAPKAFNVSTAAALVAAAAGAGARPRVVVAKHGNRSRTGRGSAEVLGALGVNVDASVEVKGRCLDEAGVCFCFAIHHHPAMKHAAAPRRSLGFPTIFNLLGPLTNPAGATRQLLGVAAAGHVELVAKALFALGAERAIVAHGLDGLDELTTTADVLMAHVDAGGVKVSTLDPRVLGLTRASLGDLQARDVEDSARIVRGVIAGEKGPHREIVVLNAAAALLVAGAAGSLKEGLEMAAAAIDSGAARGTLEVLSRVSRG